MKSLIRKIINFFKRLFRKRKTEEKNKSVTIDWNPVTDERKKPNGVKKRVTNNNRKRTPGRNFQVIEFVRKGRKTSRKIFHD